MSSSKAVEDRVGAGPVYGSDRGTDAPVVVGIFVPRHPQRFTATIRQFSREAGLPVFVAAPSEEILDDLTGPDVDAVLAPSAANMVNALWHSWGTNVLAVSDAVLVPPGVLERASRWIKDDLRVATVSFLCNDAAFLSFPLWNEPVPRAPDGHDEISVTKILREREPDALPVPIGLATGPVVLVSAAAMSAIGPLEDAPSREFAPAIADFSMRARGRGFLDVLDSRTFVTRPADLTVRPDEYRLPTGLNPDDNGWLHERHPFAHRLADAQAVDSDSALALAHKTARVSLQGLRIVVDGSFLGAQEMGSQVSTVALVRALAERPDVEFVKVVLGGAVPSYAAEAFSLPKIVPTSAPGEDFSPFAGTHIFHRPLQPGPGFPVAEWRSVADRVVISVLDLIAYHVGSYARDVETWLTNRAFLRDVARKVDGIVTISEDVADQLELERMAPERDRVFPIPYGTEHLSGDEAATMPEALGLRGFTAGEFLVCLGTNYSHKNRDLALRALGELHARGRRTLSMILAGPAVPYGSSRAAEGADWPDHGVHVLPDITPAERNWLLRHASVVLYPTSAEGFGFVPFEAARFGTPTVFVGFGPLLEIGGAQPVMAKDWSPGALADAVEAFLVDPSLAQRQVETCLAVGNNYTWARTAERLVIAYRTLLSRPARS